MALFYFHIFGGRTVIDTSGVELADTDVAREEAVRMAGAILTEEAASVAHGQPLELNVTDGQGRALFRLTICLSAA